MWFFKTLFGNIAKTVVYTVLFRNMWQNFSACYMSVFHSDASVMFRKILTYIILLVLSLELFQFFFHSSPIRTWWYHIHLSHPFFGSWYCSTVLQIVYLCDVQFFSSTLRKQLVPILRPYRFSDHLQLYAHTFFIFIILWYSMSLCKNQIYFSLPMFVFVSECNMNHSSLLSAQGMFHVQFRIVWVSKMTPQWKLKAHQGGFEFSEVPIVNIQDIFSKHSFEHLQAYNIFGRP